jgi:hypothetical protein
MAYTPVGPGFLLSTVEAGTTDTHWTVTRLRNCAFDFGTNYAWVSAAFAQVRLKSGIIALPAEPLLNASVVDADLTVLVNFILDKTITISTPNRALGLPDTVNFLSSSEVPKYGFVPLREASDGVDAAHGIWLPAAVPENVQDLVHAVIEPNTDNLNPYTVPLRGLLDDSQESAGFRCGFIGSPTAAGLGYAIPTLDPSAI